MNFIAHRINTSEELQNVPAEYGIEVDLRDYGDDLVLTHEPFQSGEKFEDYLKSYQHGTMILNIKSERIEFRVLELLQKYGIDDYFFLDSTFPMIYLLGTKEEKKIALRYSELEKMDTILEMKGKVDWVWVDCFTRLPLDCKGYETLKDAGFKLCLVSPELQGREEDIQPYKEYLSKENIIFDAICTKMHNISKWR
ncbi:MAG: hypothetical protein JKY33_03470 [Bacteroidia bacterium]|nr:hypothetical protein [Bacteroidia bacterium]